jgi:hypothetical protein
MLQDLVSELDPATWPNLANGRWTCQVIPGSATMARLATKLQVKKELWQAVQVRAVERESLHCRRQVGMLQGEIEPSGQRTSANSLACTPSAPPLAEPVVRSVSGRHI